MTTITNLEFIKDITTELNKKYEKNKVNEIDTEVCIVFLRKLLPYCVERKKGNLYLMNRNYTPLCKITTKNKFDGLYFFDDSNIPWKNKKDLNKYLKKINNFLKNI